jgi:glycosyltransferase involved in cell wall biosynthesis
MKALLVTGIYFPDIGGPATYIPTLAQALVNKGYEVSTVSLTDLLQTKRPDEPWKRIFVPRTLGRIGRTYNLYKAIRTEAKDSDFVFSNGLFPETAISLIGLRCKSTAKVVGDPVWERVKNNKGTDYSIDDFGKKFTGVKNYIQRRIMNLALNHFDILSAPSENLARNICDWGLDKKVNVIPNGVKCIEVRSQSIEFDVISIARLVNWKRIDLLIEACAIADLKLAIVGDGPERARLERLAKSTGCDASFFGHIDRGETVELLRRSLIFALLSSYEGLSFALVEAMMLEKRILVSDAPGNVAVIQDGIEGVVISTLIPSEIGTKLQTLCQDNDAQIELGIRARNKAQKHYCEEKQVAAMIELISVSA